MLRHAWMLTALAALTALAGCSANAGREIDTELYHRELRTLEDYVAALEDAIKRKEAELASCRRENQTLRRELAGEGEVEPTPRDTQPGDIPRPSPEGAGPEFPSSASVPDVSITPGKPTRGDQLVSDDDQPEDTRITQIALNPRLTGGYDFDGEPGDEGLQVIVEPQNAAGEYVARAGNLSIVVLDPQLRGAQARVARWDFTAKEAQAAIKRTLLGRGVHLEMPWPSGPPKHGELKLFVRFVTEDGRKLEASRDIRVDLPGDGPETWTPSTAGDKPPTAEPRVSSRPGDGTQSVLRRKDDEKSDDGGGQAPRWSPYR